MKKLLLVIFTLFILTGCNNEEEDEKNEYIAMKSDLLGQEEYVSKENLNCDIVVNIDRINEEKVSYEVVVSNVKENMNKIKAIVVHNYYTEDVFPTVGLFDDTKNLSIDTDDVLELSGTIETTDDIDSLGLELKILIEYTDDDGEIRDIYYKTT